VPAVQKLATDGDAARVAVFELAGERTVRIFVELVGRARDRLARLIERKRSGA
jgi:hypothetical protein